MYQSFFGIHSTGYIKLILAKGLIWKLRQAHCCKDGYTISECFALTMKPSVGLSEA